MQKLVFGSKVDVDVILSLYGAKTDLHEGNALLATIPTLTKGEEDIKVSRHDLETKNFHSLIEWGQMPIN